MTGISVHYCRQGIINHIVCEFQAMLKIVCSNTHVSLILGLNINVFTFPLPFTFIFIFYFHVLVSVLMIRSLEARLKDFFMCGSHLTMVTILYGAVIYMYLKPKSMDFQKED